MIEDIDVKSNKNFVSLGQSILEVNVLVLKKIYFGSLALRSDSGKVAFVDLTQGFLLLLVDF